MVNRAFQHNANGVVVATIVGSLWVLFSCGVVYLMGKASGFRMLLNYGYALILDFMEAVKEIPCSPGPDD